MRRRLLALLGILTLVFPATAFADDPPAERFEFAPVQGSVSTSFVPASVDPNRQVTVMLKMSGDPVAVVKAESPGRQISAERKAQVKRDLRARQDAVKPQIEALGASVLSQVQVAYNGIKVRTAQANVARLAQLPGVVDVQVVQPVELDNAGAVPWVGAPAVWEDHGLTGAGIRIAVIDTGIDYTHANFGGPGTAAAYDAADANDTDAPDPALIGPAAPKVKGGFDFVGDDYNASSDDPTQTVPQPDPDPLDCNGHGSHVAGTAAGFGVAADGTTYTGPYNETTHQTAFTIGPGVAPEAELYALRVFGCAGSTNVTVEAIDWAVDNDMDVINMSLGSTFGRADDPSAEASDNAALAGVVVVTSAGNSGAQQYIGGSPGVATRAIATAAQDTVETTPGVNLALTNASGESLGTILAQNSNDAAFAEGQTLPVEVLRNDDGSVSLGCDPQEYVDAGVEGKLVVTLRGTCARVARAVYGQQAGAAAVAMINTDAGYPPFEGPITSNPDTGEEFEVTIPFLGIRGVLGPGQTADGDTLVAADGGSATMTAASIANPNFQRFATFTSSGPRRVDSALKPDITAPGVSIQSTLVGSGSGGTRISGTSMASPVVAGVAALTVQAHPDWSTEQIKAAIVNTGDPARITAGFRISRGGTGLVQPALSVQTGVVAVGSTPGSANVSFGFTELTGDFSETKAITLVNRSSAPATFAAGTAGAEGSPHTLTILGPNPVTVPAGGSATVDVRLDVPAATVGSAAAFREVAGFVTFSPQAGSNAGVGLRVPYYLVPRSSSNISTALSGVPRPGATLQATVTNAGGTRAGDADFYQWGLEDANDGLPQNDMRAVGVQSLPSEIVGVPGDKILVFAVNTWTRWDNNAVDEYDILIDNDEDNDYEFAVVGVDIGVVTAGAFDGRMAAWVFDLEGDAAPSVFFLASHRFNNGTTTLPVFASDLGLSADNPNFRYVAAGFSLRDETGDDGIRGRAEFDAWNPAITGEYVPSVAPGGSVTTSVTIAGGRQFGHQRPLGAMVVSGDNAAGAPEAQLIKIPGLGRGARP